MADYKRIKGVPLTANFDQTGQNPGNYTASLDTSSITSIPNFECYQLSIDGPIGFGLAVYINTIRWGHTAQGWQNEWDPSQPMLLETGDTINFYWSAPETLTPVPTVVVWLRYDTSLPFNPS